MERARGHAYMRKMAILLSIVSKLVIIFHFYSIYAHLCCKKAVPLQPNILRTCVFTYTYMKNK